MDALPLELLVKILDYVEDWKTFVGFRRVSKHLKDAVDMSLQSKAKAAIKAKFGLRGETWQHKNILYQGFTMNVLCTRFKEEHEEITTPKLRFYYAGNCDRL